MRSSLSALVAVLCAGLTSCSSTNESTPTDAGGDTNVVSDGGTDVATGTAPLPCDVAEVLQRRCNSCHSNPTQFGAPMPLVTWEDLQTERGGKKVFDLVKSRIHDDARPMPQPPNARLSAADQAILDAYADKGGPKGDGTCGGPGDAGPTDTGTDTPGPGPGLKCKPDISLKPKTPFAMPKDATDLYICYGVDLTFAQKRHLTGIAPKIKNTKIVHHILLMETDTAQDTTPKLCDSGTIARARLLYAWAPGSPDFELPPQAGLPAEAGTTHFMVQTHYNNVKALEGELDDSGFDFCSTETLRPNDADVLAFGSTKFSVPAKGKLDLTCNLTVPKTFGGIHAIGVMPHMHYAGKEIETRLFPASGSPVSLGAGGGTELTSSKSFTFANQPWYPLSDILVNAGDRIETRCYYENTTDKVITSGENTDQEMCYSFTMYYPKIKSSFWSWAIPAATSKCTSK